MALLKENELIKHIKDPSGEIFKVVEVRENKEGIIIYVIESERTSERMVLHATQSSMAPWRIA